MSRYEKTVQKPHPQGYPIEPKTIGEHIKKRRMDLGLSQAQAAREISVTEDTCCYWENGRNSPKVSEYPAIIRFLGYYPQTHETETLGGKITRYKRMHGMNNRAFGALCGVDAGTVAKWERNETTPLRRSMKKVLSVLHKEAAY